MQARAARSEAVARSLSIYYGDPAHAAGLDRLYGQFVRPGDLAFDIGAHVGDRTAAFRRLGARVVAAEPQPELIETLRQLYRQDADVIIEGVAVGRHIGVLTLRINADNPTVSTASDAFVAAARDAPGWDAQRWSHNIEVPVTTLDALIAKHGRPAFAKIDVEGFEAEALAGLSAAIPALSFEFTTIQRDVALACVARCAELGYARFDAALGESQSLVHGEWRSADEIARWLSDLPHAANSGDVYAVLG